MTWLLAVLQLWLATTAQADEIRFGLFVGNNEGLVSDLPLVFAESDAEKMRDLFVSHGGMDARNAVLLLGGTNRALDGAFERLAMRTRPLVTEGHDVFFVFYYSGHGDSDSLHLGPTKLDHALLRQRLERTGAQVRIALVDACQSGGLVRRKGGTRGPSMDFATPTVESMHGSAIITSSAATELSQESSQIGGGFFTHYLHTALSGGADRNRDGVVSLAEAYDYVHIETAFSTREAPEAQTPHGDFDLSGAGSVVLTRLEAADARLAFLGDLQGEYSVWDESRKRYVAEVDGSRPITLAVRPGTFYVHRRLPGWVEEASYSVRRGETRSVLLEDFAVVTYEDTASRGELDKAMRRAKLPDLSLRLVVGYRNLGGPAGTPAHAYFRPMAVGGVQARWLSRSTNYWGVDLLAGRSSATLGFDDLSPVEVAVGSTSLLGSIGLCTRPALVRAGVGGRAGVTWLTREFPTWDVDPQVAAALTMGGNSWVGLHHGRFSVDLELDVVWLVTTWDDDPRWPSFGDLLLVGGVRL